MISSYLFILDCFVVVVGCLFMLSLMLVIIQLVFSCIRVICVIRLVIRYFFSFVPASTSISTSTIRIESYHKYPDVSSDTITVNRVI